MGLIALPITFIALTISFGGLALADNDRFERDDDDNHKSFSRNIMQTKDYQLYQKECGEACHIAFPPGMLVRSNWNKIMQSLDNHFGDNAELDTTDAKLITEFLQTEGANNIYWSRSNSDLRITKTRNFRHEHDEVPRRLVGQTAQIKSFAECQSCHTRANQGSYNERDIKITGFGAWDD